MPTEGLPLRSLSTTGFDDIRFAPLLLIVPPEIRSYSSVQKRSANPKEAQSPAIAGIIILRYSGRNR
jgi:hypothetical protein